MVERLHRASLDRSYLISQVAWLQGAILPKIHRRYDKYTRNT
jgi:hypothetical protein